MAKKVETEIEVEEEPSGILDALYDIAYGGSGGFQFSASLDASC